MLLNLETRIQSNGRLRHKFKLFMAMAGWCLPVRRVLLLFLILMLLQLLPHSFPSQRLRSKWVGVTRKPCYSSKSIPDSLLLSTPSFHSQVYLWICIIISPSPAKITLTSSTSTTPTTTSSMYYSIEAGQRRRALHFSSCGVKIFG